MPEKMISLRIDKNLDRRVRIEAAMSDLGRSEFIRQTLLEKLVVLENQTADKTSSEGIRSAVCEPSAKDADV